MFLAKELGKSLEEILDLSTLEVRMWAAFYSYEGKKQKNTQMKRTSRG